MKRLGLFVIWFCLLSPAFAQSSYSSLSRNISLKVNRQPLGEVLDKISRSGNFYFSYSGSTLKRDSLVSVSADNLAVRNILDGLFHGEVDYKERGNYVILRLITGRFDVIPENINSHDDAYEIDGFVQDSKSGKRVKDASVYEKRLLKSTLTDENGYFKLRFKGEHEGIILTVSKDNFRDTSIHFLSSISVSPRGISGSNSAEAVLNLVEKLRIGRFLTSSKQRIQSLNIPDVVAKSPFQASILPGLSSHGMLSSQIINKGSLNVLGGYTAGVNGVEVAGLFNLSKMDVHKVQVAGLLNVVGGSVNGVQTAGLFNIVLDSVKGVQVAGLFNSVSRGTDAVQVAGLINRVKNTAAGAQVAGLLNIADQRLKGVQVAGLGNNCLGETEGPQIAGLWNFNLRNMKGGQISGLINIAGASMDGGQVSGLANVTLKTVTGLQLASLINFAKRVEGTQVGLINVSDTSSGYSIGLLNLVRKGYHQVGVTANEMYPLNLSLKTGNGKLYTVLTGGLDISKSTHGSNVWGIGIGHDFGSAKNRISFAFELHTKWLNNTYLDQPAIVSRVEPNIQIRIMKGMRLNLAPAYSALFGTTKTSLDPRNGVIPTYAHSLQKRSLGWPGFGLGLLFF